MITKLISSNPEAFQRVISEDFDEEEDGDYEEGE